MQLAKKKELAANVLGVGKARVYFVDTHLSEIKEAITRQDIIDLKNAGAIKVKDIKGRLAIVKRKHRRGKGKVKLRVKKTKQEYVKLTRKLRMFAKHLLKTKKIDDHKYKEIRKMIKASRFKSKRHFIEIMGDIK